MVVDDVAWERRLTGGLFREGGYEVEEAASAAEAIAKVASAPERYAAVLLDLYMPDMDGLEAIRSLRRGGYEGRIVAVSNGGSVAKLDLLHVARLLGADESFYKPLTEADAARVAGLIEGDCAA